MLEILLKTLGSSVTATLSIAMMILFLRHLKHRDQTDTLRHQKCEDTITNIVKKHEDSQKALLNTFRTEK